MFCDIHFSQGAEARQLKASGRPPLALFFGYFRQYRGRIIDEAIY